MKDNQIVGYLLAFIIICFALYGAWMLGARLGGG